MKFTISTPEPLAPALPKTKRKTDLKERLEETRGGKDCSIRAFRSRSQLRWSFSGKSISLPAQLSALQHANSQRDAKFRVCPTTDNTVTFPPISSQYLKFAKYHHCWKTMNQGCKGQRLHG